MAADLIHGRPDNKDRGLMMLAWSNGRPVACVSRGKFTGMTAGEVAERCGVSVDVAREQLLDGEIPQKVRHRGRKVTDETIARRRAAGVPEELLRETLPTIARELRISQHELNSAIYRNGPKVGR